MTSATLGELRSDASSVRVGADRDSRASFAAIRVWLPWEDAPTATLRRPVVGDDGRPASRPDGEAERRTHIPMPRIRVSTVSAPPANGASARRRRRSHPGCTGLRARLVDLAAGLDPVLEAAEVEHLVVAEILQELAGQRRAPAGGAMQDDGLVLAKFLSWPGDSGSALNSSEPRGT